MIPRAEQGWSGVKEVLHASGEDQSPEETQGSNIQKVLKMTADPGVAKGGVVTLWYPGDTTLRPDPLAAGLDMQWKGRWWSLLQQVKLRIIVRKLRCTLLPTGAEAEGLRVPGNNRGKAT